MTELALAFFCAPREVQERLENEHLAASQTLPQMQRKWIE
jgi:hypothetical protein